MIDDDTRQKIITHLSNWIDNLDLDALTGHAEKEGKHKPFHNALFSELIINASAIERSTSTGLGNTFEECAKLISKGHRHYDIKIRVGQNQSNEIERIVENIQQNGVTDDFPTMINKITSIKDTEFVRNTIRSDIFVHNTYFEIKSPKPNKDQCLAAVRRHLTLHAAKNYDNIKTYFAMPYNPWGNREDFNHSFAKKYLDMKNHVLIGKEFWDLLGGPGTYEELLNIYKDVGMTKKSVFESF